MIAVIGFMGAGKTTVGRLVADRLGVPFCDSDQLIERQQGRSIRAIFDTDGEAHFRELEHRAVAALADAPQTVVALGGGAVIDPRTRVVLRHAQVVYLTVDLGEALGRVGGDPGRPMLRRDLDALYADRLPVYQEVGTLRIDTTGRTPDDIADEVLRRLAAQPPTDAPDPG